MDIKKGDIVGRKSYNKDIFFRVHDIIKNDKNEYLAILKGIAVRIEADSPISDLEIIEERTAQKLLLQLDQELEERKYILYNKQKELLSKRFHEYYGRILHLDGDKKYSDKSQKFYKNMGIDAVVKNITESKQPKMVSYLLGKYNPDVLVITGQDGMIKNGFKYNDIYNYRNSKYFIESVLEARKWERETNKLAIFAGACQSYYEAIMEAGANFASSPARILIDFKDPLIVAERISTTDHNIYLTIDDLKRDLRDGENGISGIGSLGKKIELF